jgi:hypothetical protein
LEFHTLGSSHRGIVALDNGSGRKQRFQGLDDQVFSLIHGDRQRLDHQIAAVAINNQPGEPIALAPDQPSRVAILRPLLPDLMGLPDSPKEKFQIKLLATAGKSTRDDL